MEATSAHNQGPIHVLVGDNSKIHSYLLAEALQGDPHLRVAGSASNSHDVLEIGSRNRVDVALISATLDDDPLGGLATFRELHESRPQILGVILVDSPKRDIVLHAFRAGARGIFSRHESVENLCKCVRVVFEGQVWARSREVRFALEALSSTPTIRAINARGLNLLSRRERQVVHYLAEGLTNRKIGDRLGLSQHTIKNYLLKIFDKLGVSNRVELLFLTLSQPRAAIPVVEEDED